MNLRSTTQGGGKIPSQQVGLAITLFLKKVDLNDLKLSLSFHYNITGRSLHQVLFFQWQGIGPARTWRSAATGQVFMRWAWE